MGVLGAAVLDVEQLLADRHGGLAPVSPEPMNSLSSLSTPIGVITAAVPQAKTSVISPDADAVAPLVD